MSETEILACSVCRLGPPDWQYTCQDCGHEFAMPAAKGPTEERKRACPECGSHNILYESITSEACAPGG